jgi:NADH dehydrogenase FAD-containing subunit
LILATGTRTIGDLPWKSSVKGYEATKEILHKYRDQVKTAKSIVLGGGGPTGAETAGELGFEFRKSKEITLITSAPELCADSLSVNIAKVAEKELQKLHVKIVKGVKITGVKPTEDGKTELTLDNGETKITDLYLPTVGVLPNSEYVPKALLDEKGYVVVDQNLRVKNATDIWAAGDIIDIEPSQLVYCEKQATALAKNLDLTLKGKEPVPYKTGGDRKYFSSPSLPSLKYTRLTSIRRSGSYSRPQQSHRPRRQQEDPKLHYLVPE